MTIRVEVRNMKELVAQLDGLEADIKHKVIQTSLLDAAKIVQRVARSLSPLKTGSFRQSIRVRKLKKKEFRGADEIGAVVDFNTKEARYAHIVEGGAKPHVIVPRKKSGKKALKFKGGYVSRVRHPGFKGKNVLQKAWTTSQASVEKNIEDSITKSVRKIAKKRGLT
jgi:HK97 gp10 family phage protein